MKTATKTTKIIYFITTGLLATVAVLSGIINISMNETVEELCKTHGFNILIAPFFGTVKILGAAAITLPFLRQFRTAAYHGFIFYFIGATYFNIIDGSKSYTTTIVILIIASISYIFYNRVNKKP